MYGYRNTHNLDTYVRNPLFSKKDYAYKKGNR